MGAVIRVVRGDVGLPDAYDRHVAIVKIDGVKVGQLAVGHEESFNTAPGEHEVSLRLRYNFGTAKVRVGVGEGQTVSVVGEKARYARNAIPPSRYWRLTVN